MVTKRDHRKCGTFIQERGVAVLELTIIFALIVAVVAPAIYMALTKVNAKGAIKSEYLVELRSLIDFSNLNLVELNRSGFITEDDRCDSLEELGRLAKAVEDMTGLRTLCAFTIKRAKSGTISLKYSIDAGLVEGCLGASTAEMDSAVIAQVGTRPGDHIIPGIIDTVSEEWVLGSVSNPGVNSSMQGDPGFACPFET